MCIRDRSETESLVSFDRKRSIKTIAMARVIAIKSQDRTSQAKKGSAFFNTASYIDIGSSYFFKGRIITT